jgi:hypothetical protein
VSYFGFWPGCSHILRCGSRCNPYCNDPQAGYIRVSPNSLRLHLRTSSLPLSRPWNTIRYKQNDQLDASSQSRTQSRPFIQRPHPVGAPFSLVSTRQSEGSLMNGERVSRIPALVSRGTGKQISHIPPPYKATTSKILSPLISIVRPDRSSLL